MGNKTKQQKPKQKTEAKKPETPLVTWWDSIKFFRDFAEENRGTMGIMAEAMRLRTGRDENWRVMVDLWTTRNDERRVEPKYSTGVIVIEEAVKVIENVRAQKMVVAG